MIIHLIIVWFLFWGLYNFILLPKGYSTEKTPHILTHVYMLFTILTVYISGFQLFPQILWLFIVAVFAWYVRERGGMRVGRLGNSIFQIVWLYCIFLIYESTPHVAILIFGSTHLGIFFIKHLTIVPKSLIVLNSFVIALVIVTTFQWLPYPLSLVIGILVHYMVYVIARPIDRRYRWKMIN